MKTSLIFLALIVLISGCAGFPAGTKVTDTLSLPTIMPPTTEALSGDIGGSEPAQATTTTLQTTTNSCPVPHGAGNYAGGLCAVVSCDSGYYNCDGNGVNGCEATTACATTTTSPASTTTTLANTTTTAANATTTTSGATTTTAAATTTTVAATTTTAAPTTTTTSTTTTSSTTTTTPPTTTTTTTPKPDLTMTYVGKAQGGGSVRIDFTVNNVGSAPAGISTAEAKAIFQGGGTTTCTYSTSVIASSGTESGNCFVSIGPGTYDLSLTADLTGAIDESNESNNVATTTITVT